MGVKLHGHETLHAFALQARRGAGAHVIVGEREAAARFWSQFAARGQTPARVRREQMMVQRWPVPALTPTPGLRRATQADLPHALLAHARLAFEESGVDPLQVDPEGFRARLARRIERGRVWVWVEGGRLIFKADVVSDTPEAVYLEGVYVSPEERGKGYGLRCVSHLSRELLRHSRAICLLANEENQRALSFYRRAGYRAVGAFDMIFLRQQH